MLENNGIPLYLQLYDKLKQKIIREEWPQDSAIPTEAQLMKTYGVGRETVRRGAPNWCTKVISSASGARGPLSAAGARGRAGTAGFFYGRNGPATGRAPGRWRWPGKNPTPV